VLATVQVLPNLSGSVSLMVKVRDEGGDGALEIDVVLPECVVGVDEEGLAWAITSELERYRHISIIGVVLSTQ
jgi:hypothetical protein